MDRPSFRVLLIAAKPETRLAIQRALTFSGQFSVDSVSNLSDANKKLVHRAPDLVMFDSKGFDFSPEKLYEGIRHNELASSPVLILVDPIYLNEPGGILSQTGYRVVPKTADFLDSLADEVTTLINENQYRSEVNDLRTLCEKILATIEEGVIGIDENGKVLFSNKTARSLLGFNVDEELIGSVNQFIPQQENPLCFDPHFMHKLHSRKTEKKINHLHLINAKREGFQVRARLIPLSIRHFPHSAIFVFSDTSEMYRFQQRTEHLFTHDVLTDLVNRNYFISSVEKSIARARRHNHKIGLVILHLDNFKKINERFGHEIGDRILVESANRLKQSVRGGDMVGRLGGNEFGVLVEKIADAEALVLIANKIISTLEAVINLGSYEVKINTHMGLAMFPDHADDADHFLRAADTAFYHARTGKEDQYLVYSSKMSSETNINSTGVAKYDFDKAFRNKEFEIHYQAITRCSESRLHGLEALLRWRHPELGLLTPEQFFTELQHSSVVVELERQVLREALQQFAQWRNRYEPVFQSVCLGLNLSERQLANAELSDEIKVLLDEFDLPAEAVQFEFSERKTINAISSSAHALDGLHALGCKIVIDNYGSSFATTRYLNRFPFSHVKLHKSLVKGIENDDAASRLCAATIAMLKAMNLAVTAVGVESSRQMEILIAQGCDSIQGFLLGKPQAASDMDKRLQQYLDNQDVSDIG